MNNRTYKHDIHIEKDGARIPRERQPQFAEVELDVPVHEEKEPISRVVTPDRYERDVEWGDSFRYVSREGQFVQQARDLEEVAVEHAEFVPFHTYWPTYEQMQSAQKRWYLYWRGEVRAGRYPDTDLSYVFVYLYELIHGIGWREPKQGYELMDRIWQAYRQRYPKLDQYVREWLYDLVLVFGLDPTPAEPLSKIPRSLSPELRELEWRRRFRAEPLELTWELLLQLIDYEVEKGRYYREQGRKVLREYLPKVVVLVDGYLSKTKGRRLLDLFMPREKRVTRYLFRSAVYDHGLYGRTITVPVLPISQHPPLRAYLTQLTRLTENQLRELTGFKGRLRGIQVEPEVEQIISRYLRKEFELRRAKEVKSQVPAIKINTAKLRKLQRESDEVRDMLLTEELKLNLGDNRVYGKPSGESDDPVTQGTTASFGAAELISQAKPGASKAGRHKAGNEPQQGVLDFERGWLGYEEESYKEETQGKAASPEEKPKEVWEPEEMRRSDERVKVSSAERAEGSSEERAKGHSDKGTEKHLLEQLVEQAPVDSHEKDLSQKLHTCAALSEDSPFGEGGAVYLDTDGQLIDEADEWPIVIEWQELAARLSEPHRKLLAALLRGEGDAVRYSIAEEAGSMPELMMDEINEISMEQIGDLLIDVDEITEEYRDELHHVLRRGS
ncbi:TerB N-terminal domain-containing protein [Paenibacillus sp. CAA11]|uniref:TerB N-terminal domain-containing protein n=1 Tax=Paenibacillus sp. CAA11 TaxID=1532905 RepID=UPI001F40FD17|nr:TerB N-terminal domain-containing protein [Paenibacillus sp. CAA11]